MSETITKDMMDISEVSIYVLVRIDYYTKVFWAKLLENKQTDGVVESLKE